MMLRLVGTIGTAQAQVLDIEVDRIEYAGRGHRWRYAVAAAGEHVAHITHDTRDGPEVLARHALGAIIAHRSTTRKG